jgi:hypothetical protein
MNARDILEARIAAAAGAPLEATDEEIDALSDDDVAYLVDRHGSGVLLRLPPRERTFFDWVKREDEAVWTDLWESDENLLVALAFLGDLRASGPGFLICELEGPPNYFFTPRHIKPEGLAAMPGILARAERGGELSTAEGLMFAILAGPVDIWHFCYKYNVPLRAGKDVVDALEQHGWLAHVTSREDSIRYV